jgi:ATP-dependent protease ClpP protease subunit
LIVPKPAYRPNPNRAIYIQGLIDDQLIYRLTPQILTLQSENRSPITVYIDSPGGSISNAESLWRLLTASNQDLASPCHIITVATSKAASAAADLLSSGDYAIAFPQSTILYHGVRTFRDVPLTVETTSLIASLLRTTNETYAMELMRKIEFRFMFRFLLSKSQFDKIREKNPTKQMTDTECFQSIISDSLSERAKKLLEMARTRQGRYDALLDIAKKSPKDKSIAKTEARRIKAMVAFEVSLNKKDPNWTFQGGGLTRLNDDFFLLNEHLASSESDRFDKLCTTWGKLALSRSEREEIDKTPEESKDEKLIQKVRPLLEPLWSFFVALCHVLQEGENELTATDAFWLGLIDEVMGVKELSGFREIMEYEPDPPKPEIGKVD